MNVVEIIVFYISKIINIYDPDKNNCIICLQDYNNDNRIDLKCNHSFHKVCLNKWKQRKDECPICRRKIAIENYDRNENTKIFIFILLISLLVSLIILIALIPNTRTSKGIREISKKIYDFNREIFINIFNFIYYIFDIIFYFIEQIFYLIKKIFINIAYIVLTLIDLLYRIVGLVLIILISILLLILDIIIDNMNYIISFSESIFKLI